MKMILLVILTMVASADTGMTWIIDGSASYLSIIIEAREVERFDESCDDERTGSMRQESATGELWVCVRFYDDVIAGAPRKWWVQFPRRCGGSV